MTPVAAAGVALVGFFVPNSRDPAAPSSRRLRLRTLDGDGQPAVFTLIKAPTYGWATSRTLLSFAGVALLVVVFGVWETRRSEPMLDLALFRNLRFTAASLAVAISFFALSGFIFLVVQYFQSVKGWGPLSTGVRLLPVALSVAVSSIAGPKVAVRVGTKLVVASGLLLATGFYIWVAHTSVSTSYTTIAGQMVVLGLGMGLASAPATEAIMGVVPPAKAGVGSAANDATRLMGGTLGVAVIGSVYASIYSNRLTGSLPHTLPANVTAAAHSSVGAGLSAASKLAADHMTHVAQLLHASTTSVFFDGFHTADYVAVAVAAGGVLMVLALLPTPDRRGVEPRPLTRRWKPRDPVSGNSAGGEWA